MHRLPSLSQISTHTLHAGRDRKTVVFKGAVTISTHTPHAGRDMALRTESPTTNISTHTPHAGRDQWLLCWLPPVLIFQLTRPMRGVTATFCFVMRSSSIYWGGLYFYQHFSKLFTTNVAYFMQIIRRTSRKFYITSGSHYSTQRVHLPNHSLLLHLCAQFSCANHCRGSKISGCRTLSQLSSRAHL